VKDQDMGRQGDPARNVSLQLTATHSLQHTATCYNTPQQKHGQTTLAIPSAQNVSLQLTATYLLQHTHCNTLQCTATESRTNDLGDPERTKYVIATHGSKLTATHRNTLQHTATHCNGSTNERSRQSRACQICHCNSLQHTYCNTLTAIHYNTLQQNHAQTI